MVGTSPHRANTQIAAKMIHAAHSALALAGAAISTGSGIPDLRSSGSGLWRDRDPMAVASLPAIRYQPECFFERVRPPGSLPEARPAQSGQRGAGGPRAGGPAEGRDPSELRRLSPAGRLGAGSGAARHFPPGDLYGLLRRVLHGPAGGAMARIRMDPALSGLRLDRQAEGVRVRRRDAACQGAWQWVRERDLCRVVGSSLEVKPAASPPFEAVSAGADLIIINRKPTYLDCRAAQVLQEEAAEVLAALVREVLCDRTPL